jgi:hypothetical protein
MFNSLKLTAGIALATALAVPHIAFAQNYESAGFTQENHMNVQASVTFTIPLGSTDRRRTSDQPRLGFGLGLSPDDFNARLRTERLNLLNIGAYGFDTPSFQLNDQEIFKPTFIALHADEAGEEDAEAKGSNTLLWVLGGGAVLVGALVLGNEAYEDDLKDSLNDQFNTD